MSAWYEEMTERIFDLVAEYEGCTLTAVDVQVSEARRAQLFAVRALRKETQPDIGFTRVRYPFQDASAHFTHWVRRDEDGK